MPDATDSASTNLPADQEALLTQLVAGPSIREVATQALIPALKALYTNLPIDPRLAMVVTPTWIFHDQHVVPGPRHFESLTDALVRHGVTKTPVVYLDGEHFLTLQPQEPTPTQLPVSIDAIGRLLNELAPLLFVAFQEQQVDYWNQFTGPSTPRWQGLSKSLREFWNLETSPDWDSDQIAMARHLFAHPDKSTRSVDDRFASRACLIDLDYVSDNVSTHINTLDVAVLIGTLAGRTLILSHTITRGFQACNSLQELGESLQTYVDGESAGKTLQWRLIEPEGNFFDHVACNLIALQADAIGALGDNDSAVANTNLAPHISRTTNELDPTDKQSSTRFKQVEQALPDWMAGASSRDLTAYSRHLMDLATVRNRNAGQSFQDGIKPIREFALEQLRETMLKQHADAAQINLADIEIEVDSLVVWGSFIPLVEPERTTLSLVDLALQNLIALPRGNKSVRSSSAAALPAWMTVSYLEALIVSVDIGKNYPALIKSKLLDDPLDSLRRQNLFTSHLRVELPLLALQQKIRAQNGIDELGYRYVAAVVQVLDSNRWVDGQEIVIRPLAFSPGWRVGGSTDEVTNMFVIGPRQMDKGPCLLYRPLLDQPLSQYPTPANLIYAIKHSPTLRQSVLAWLPEGARANYANYMFTGDRPSVWSVSQLLADPLTSLQMNGPLSLGTQVIATDYLATLYKANVNAMVGMAQRQSVSNAQNRWDTFKHAAWMILNAALPFLGKTVGTAAWVWQVLDDLQNTLDAGETGDREQQKTAMTDLLLTLAMVLAHHASTRSPTGRRIEEEKPATVATERQENPAGPVTFSQNPEIVGEQPAQHRISVLTDTALSLTKTLDRFSITRPGQLTPPDSESGIHRYLYQHAGKYYAPVGERWFEVTVEDSGEVSIIDTRQQPLQSGPALISNNRGEWFVDTRLRLRGGGLSSRRKALQQQNRARIAELKKQLVEFDNERERAREELTDAHNAMKNTVGDEALLAAQGQFLEKLERRTQDYAIPIEQLKSLNLLDTVHNYRTTMVEMLGTQLFFNQTWLDQRAPTFAQTLRETLALLEAEETAEGTGDRATYKKMVDLTEGMIGKIEFAQSRFQELSRLGRSAAEVASTYRTKLPAFSLNDLKGLQVSLAREVCLKEGNSVALTQARSEFMSLLDTSNLIIQTSQELMVEGGTWKVNERVEGLSGLVEQFATIDQSFEDFALNHKDAVLEQPFKHLRSRISGFQQAAENFLAQLLREQQPLEPRPAPSRSGPASRKRVIKTRFKGTVVGEVRPSAPGEAILLDVKSPMTGKVIATFHEKTPGVWLERVKVRPRRPTAPVADLDTQITQSRTLLDGVESFIRQTEASAKKPGRIPVEIEELFQNKAEQLDKSAKALEQAPTHSNSTDSTTTLVAELGSARDRLYAEGHRIRVEMIKQQPPTAARVEWLSSKNEIDISPSGGRRRLKGPRKDYLQEYEIRERGTGQTLWYAHFHYAAADSPVEAFTAAHLKLHEQRVLAGAYDLRSASSSEVIAIYRSAISPQLASSLFFRKP
ncbi:dermonecrotic toxin domain-containing protein [Pseudomonas sp. R37(2017)]|uniref:dermonecrotic toxin domain-containing protein n=1 Tax=Pseudomonas sp. R37(2017) TaxID=1981685 RepID=UPI000A1ECFCF|nr:DUF6543 domain-containing protein [Pseudomonas sp. R37(2017)]